MSGWIVLAFGLVLGVADFFVGLNMSRKTAARMAPGLDGTPAAPEAAEQFNRLGRMVMMTAFVILAVAAGIAFGFIPSGGIEPIEFN